MIAKITPADVIARLEADAKGLTVDDTYFPFFTDISGALDLLALIPNDRPVLRRVVGARALRDRAGNHLYSWRRLGALIGASPMEVQRWHAQGIDMIVVAMNAKDK